jgi:hypothetical protein
LPAPNSALSINEQRATRTRARVASQPADTTVLQLVQPAECGRDEDAPVRTLRNRRRLPGTQPLGLPERQNARVAQAVQPASSADPQTALTILENRGHAVVREAMRASQSLETGAAAPVETAVKSAHPENIVSIHGDRLDIVARKPVAGREMRHDLVVAQANQTRLRSDPDVAHAISKKAGDVQAQEAVLGRVEASLLARNTPQSFVSPDPQRAARIRRYGVRLAGQRPTVDALARYAA